MTRVLIAMLLALSTHLSAEEYVKRIFGVEVEGEVKEAIEGEPIVIANGQDDMKLKVIDLKKVRVKLDSIEVEIPGVYADEIDVEDDMKSITLDGNNVVFTIFNFGDENVVDGLIEESARTFTSMGEVERGEGKVAGKKTVKLTVQMGAEKITFDYLPIVGRDGSNYLITHTPGMSPSQCALNHCALKRTGCGTTALCGLKSSEGLSASNVNFKFIILMVTALIFDVFADHLV